MEALATLERILQETNSYGDAEEKERVISEVSAARRLLNSAKVRIGAISAVISVPVLFLVKKFADVAIGDAAGAVMQTLEKLLGTIF
jgi:hypothetical protein